MEPSETPLESLLDQTIDEFNLRNILVAYGIPNDEIVKIELSTENRIIASCYVPGGSNVTPFEGSSAPVSGLRDQVKDFFNYGEKKFKLLQQIEDYKTPSSLIKVTLHIGNTLVARKVKVPRLTLLFFMAAECPCEEPYNPHGCCLT